MRILTTIAAGLVLVTAFSSAVAEQRAVEDKRYPVTLTPSESLAQKAQMQQSLVALRQILAALAVKDFAEVERATVRLGHTGMPSAQQTVTTSVYRKMEAQFQEATGKVTVAARAADGDAVLRELSEVMGWCQSCHSALRQEVVPAEPDNSPADK